METTLLATHILKVIAQHQISGRQVSLQTLVDELKVRRADIRRVVTALDNEGYLDAMRMSLTMTGFAIGGGLLERELPPLRQQKKLALLAA
jgi:DNA-binding IclR family transcriptional regulator